MFKVGGDQAICCEGSLTAAMASFGDFLCVQVSTTLKFKVKAFTSTSGKRLGSVHHFSNDLSSAFANLQDVKVSISRCFNMSSYKLI